MTISSGDPFDLVGTTLAGKYRVEALVERTDQSIVYRATHAVWHRPVAIKAFKASTADEKARSRLLQAFVREGALLAALSERCAAICQARDLASVTTANGDWVPYMVLEWLNGEPLELLLLRERAARVRPRTAAQAIQLLDGVAAAIALAHEQGIVHRDVKPGNIFVLADPRSAKLPCKLLDFGVAQVESAVDGDESRSAGAATSLPGAHQSFTPAYGAPEQFSSEYGPTGPWTDVYALALVFVELVSGRPPLVGESVSELAQSSCNPVDRPTPRTLGVVISDELERVLRRALAIQPSERFGGVGEFWSALTSAAARQVADGGLLAITLERSRRTGTRRWGRSAAALAAVCAAMMVLQYWPAITHAVASSHAAASLHAIASFR